MHKFEKDDFNPPDKSTPEFLGIYEFKPVAQEQWEKMIASALENVADLFPYIDDIWHLQGNEIEIYATTADFFYQAKTLGQPVQVVGPRGHSSLSICLAKVHVPRC